MPDPDWNQSLATEYDRAGRATETFEDVDGASGTNAQTTSQATYDAAGRMTSSKDRRQAADSGLGASSISYDELGRVSNVVDASGSSPNVSSTTRSTYDALDRQQQLTVGYYTSTAQTTTTAYDLGGRTIAVDDEFTCRALAFDYRDLALIEVTGLVGGTCATGSDQRTLANSHDGLGRLTRSEVAAGSDVGDRTFDVAIDSAGRQLTSAVKRGGVVTTTTFTLNPLDQSITHQGCVVSAGHACSWSIATGSDSYSYDDNDNRTTVNESNGATSSDRRYCYDAQDRLQYRNTGAACSSTAKDESYTYDEAGNRLSAFVDGSTTNFAYDGEGQLCKVGATSCGTPNVTYDSAAMTTSLNGWVYEYDSEGRLVRACESSSCSGSIDKVEFAYDGEGHRTQTKEYTAGTLTATRDFRYQGDAIVEESTNGTVSRAYAVDEAGGIVKFCDPNCASPTTSYLVTWNGHGDALAAWRINGDGTLTLANSYTYSSWGAPTTATHNSIADLGFRFLYVGAYDVQWDNFSGLGLHYMHARHYSPAIARFLQPDPARAESNHYAYATSNPLTIIDPTGLFGGWTDAEYRLCREDYWQCMDKWDTDIYSATQAALNTIGERGTTGALRHCIQQCALTIRWGSARAKQWGDAHETGPGTYLSHMIDYYNNSVGRSLGRWISANRGWLWIKAVALRESKNICIQALRHGWLRINRNGRSVPSNTP